MFIKDDLTSQVDFVRLAGWKTDRRAGISLQRHSKLLNAGITGSTGIEGSINRPSAVDYTVDRHVSRSRHEFDNFTYETN
jgi:hypothetical protein